MTDNLVAALARAQANFGPVVKAHVNPHFKSKYADLSDLLAVVRPPLNAEGVWLTQPLETDDDGRVRLFTRLEGHGEVRESCLPLHTENMNPQQLLSTVTYYRRAELASMLGVAAEDDDDGNLAATAPARTYSAAPSAQTIGHGKDGAVMPAGLTGSVTDPYAAAAATPPEKPLAAMTAGEMARYAESIGVRVSGSKADILRQLQPIVLAASGDEPWPVEGEGESSTARAAEAAPESAAKAPPSHPEPERPEFSPVVAGSATVRTGVRSSLAAEK